MTDKNAILLIQSEDENEIKEVFTLHLGDNTLGSDNDCDIVLQISPDIEPLHAKIIVDTDFGDIGIEDISLNKGIMKEKNGKKYKLKKRRDYELFPGRKFYLTKTIEFTLFQGTNREVEQYLEEINMEHLKDYLYTKKTTIFDQNKETEQEDEAELPLEFEDKPVKKKRMNMEDFNNFDYIPMGDDYNDNDDNGKKLESSQEKILKEILDAPEDLGEIINSTNTNKHYFSEYDGVSSNLFVQKKIDQMLTKRLTQNNNNHNNN